MWFSPSIFLMSLSILTRIFLVISSPSIFIAWIGLELNTLAFMPILLVKKSKLSREASIKYFLTQTLASLLILIRGLATLTLLRGLGSLTLLLGLRVKLGAAPFHRWLISIAESIGWVPLFTLLTVQKINPLLVIWNFRLDKNIFFYTVAASSLVLGGLAGLTQTRTRSLMTFSSINHVGWLITALGFGVGVATTYFFIYLVTLLSVILIFYIFNISQLTELPLLGIKSRAQLVLFFSLFSLGGLPPFLGFLPKWLVLQLTITESLFWLSLVIILIRLFVLFFYLRLIFSAFILRREKTVACKSSPSITPLYLTILLSVSLGGLGFVFFL